MTIRTLLALAIGSLAASAVILLTADVLWAGHPSCEKPPCNMQSCQSFNKKGKPSGSKCSNDCTEKCCFCKNKQACNMHHQSSPDEESYWRRLERATALALVKLGNHTATVACLSR